MRQHINADAKRLQLFLDGDRGELDETGVPGRLAIFDDRSAVLRLPGLDPRAGRAPVARDHTISSENEGAFRMSFQTLDSRPQGAGQQPVIGVEKRDVSVTCRREARVAGRGESLVRLPEIEHLGMARGHARCLVRRAIVDEDHLRRRKRPPWLPTK